MTCSLHGNSVTLKCDVFLYDESPPLNNVYWTKGDKHIVIATNNGKYAGANKNDPSLTIYNVNYDDADDYQLIAVNPVGETWSKVILLGNNIYESSKCLKKLPLGLFNPFKQQMCQSKIHFTKYHFFLEDFCAIGNMKKNFFLLFSIKNSLDAYKIYNTRNINVLNVLISNTFWLYI